MKYADLRDTKDTKEKKKNSFVRSSIAQGSLIRVGEDYWSGLTWVEIKIIFRLD